MMLMVHLVVPVFDLMEQGILNDDQIPNIPVLILANKIDKPGAASEDEIRVFFELNNKTTGKVKDTAHILLIGHKVVMVVIGL